VDFGMIPHEFKPFAGIAQPFHSVMFHSVILAS